MEKDIKDYRNEELKSYIIANILLVLLSSGLLNQILWITKDLTLYEVITSVLSSAVFSSILYIYIFLADALVPGEWKNNLIWFIFGKPGNSIFTKIRENNNDGRFTSEKAIEMYKDIYNDIDKKRDKSKKNVENSAWYKIYKKYETNVQVNVSQREFLLCRDMSVMTILLAVGYMCLQAYLKQCISWKMILVFIIEFLMCWIAAGIKSWRFAYNVIAIDIAMNDKKDE